MKDLIHDLMLLGFSRKEALIYISALECGEAGAHEIALRAKINRATTYSVLKILIIKGLIILIDGDGDRRYRAEAPQRISTLLDLQKKELEYKQGIAEKLMLRLQVFHNVSSTKPTIKYHESFDGLRSMQKEYEQLDGDIIQIVGLDTLSKLRGKIVDTNHLETMIKKRKIRAIIISDEIDEIPEVKNMEYVIIPSDFVDVKGEMTVCGDRLILFSYILGIVAVEIHSKTIADTARVTLELAWQRALEWQKQNSNR